MPILTLRRGFTSLHTTAHAAASSMPWVLKRALAPLESGRSGENPAQANPFPAYARARGLLARSD